MCAFWVFILLYVQGAQGIHTAICAGCSGCTEGAQGEICAGCSCADTGADTAMCPDTARFLDIRCSGADTAVCPDTAKYAGCSGLYVQGAQVAQGALCEGCSGAHTAICVLILLSRYQVLRCSYCYMCPDTARYEHLRGAGTYSVECAHTAICVLILLYRCIWVLLLLYKYQDTLLYVS